MLLEQGHGYPFADQLGQGHCRQNPSPHCRRACRMRAAEMTSRKEAYWLRGPLFTIIIHESACADHCRCVIGDLI